MKNKILIVDNESIELFKNSTYDKLIELPIYKKPMSYNRYITICCNEIHVNIKMNKHNSDINIILSNQFAKEIKDEFKNYSFSKLDNVYITTI